MQGFQEQAIIEIRRIFTFYHFHFATGYVFPGERHPFWEMVYLLNGQVDIGADERVYALNAGDLIFHQPDEYHSSVASYAHAPDMVVISFDSQSEAMRRFARRCMHLDEAQQAEMNALLAEAYRTYAGSLSEDERIERSGHRGGAYTLRLMLTVLLTHLMAASRPVAPTSAPAISLPDPHEEHLMRAIVDYMRAHLQQGLRLDALCRQIGVSETTLKRLFRSNFSSSPIAYFERLRMIEAQKLMRQSHAGVAAVADALGFSSPAYFATRFRHVTGQTPREYLRTLGLKA